MRSCNEGKHAHVPVSVDTVPTPVNKTGLWRFFTPVRKEKISPCRALCPLESGIPRWMKEVSEGNWQQAWNIMREYNPFPAITGFTCYRFCMENCSRSSLDESIAIGEIEKEIGLWRHQNFESGRWNGACHHPRQSKKVAIVGSGPAGLSCAYYLNMLGAEVTVFEKLPVAGGLLATGIPEYRLPRDVLAKELEILEAEGISFAMNHEVKSELDLHGLQEDFDAVLFAVGAQVSRPLNVSGEQLPGVTSALEFLRNLHLEKVSDLEGRVLVVGGGNAALDAACAAARNGAENVTLLYRRSEDEMPAHPDEIKAARDAGVNFAFQTAVEEILGEGKVQKVRAVRTAFSRRGEKIKILSGTEHYLECSLIIAAVGQESSLTTLAVCGDFPGENATRSVKGGWKKVFAAGDAVTGPSTVPAAIFEGRKAALELFALLRMGKGAREKITVVSPMSGQEEAVNFESLNPSLYLRQGRQNLPQDEAGRCFSCGVCSKCGVCWVFCPDLAVDGDTGNYDILLDYCKGCGICVTECPAGAMVMEGVDSSGA